MVSWRVGMGFDMHPFGAGRGLVLGGVEVSYPRGLAGHSDGDVLLHAIMDAMLGACGKGDIGLLFPPGDPRYRDANSCDLLLEVRKIVGEEGWHLVNLDATVVCQEPRVSPYFDEMRRTISDILETEPEDINVKATSPEWLGALGRADGVAAFACVLVTAGPASGEAM